MGRDVKDGKRGINLNTTKNVIKELGIGESTLRKYCIALEKVGYKFTKKESGKRLFNESDVEIISKMKEIVRNESASLKESATKIFLKLSIEPKPVDELTIKEYKNQRVITFKDMDEVHGRVEGTAKRNYMQNKKHLIKDVDYFFITTAEKNEFRTLEIPNRGLILLTESGYLMLVKSFTDDLAWNVQRSLINSYFRAKQTLAQPIFSYMIEDPVERAKAWIKEQEEKKRIETEKLMLEQKVAESEPKITYYDEILKSTDIVTITQIAKDYGMSGQALNDLLHEEGIQYKQSGQWLLYHKYQDKGYTKSDTQKFFRRNGEIGVSLHTKWTQKGRLFIHELLADKGISPLMDQEKSPVLQH